MSKPDYDTTLARMAGNLASALVHDLLYAKTGVDEQTLARDCVSLARAIVAEVKRTEPAAAPKVATHD